MMSNRLLLPALSLLLYGSSTLHAQAPTTDTPAGAPPATEAAPTADPTTAAPTTPPPSTPAAPNAPAAEAAGAVASDSVAATQSPAPASDPKDARQEETARIKQQLAEARAARPPVEQRVEPHAAPVDARAARARWTIAVSADTLFMSDPGYAFFSEDDVSSRLGIWLGADVVDFGERCVLGVEIGIGTERDQSDDVWDGDVETELRSTTLQAGASLKFPVLPWLVPQVRLAGGASLLSMEVDTSRDEPFEDDAVSPFGTLGAGVALQTPSQLFANRSGEFASLSFGFLIEGGYGLRAPAKFQLKTEASGKPIPVTDAELGELALAGPYVRTSVVVRF